MASNPDSNHLSGSEVGTDFIESLSHWGVKGMKWGVRRSDAELAKSSPKEKASEDFTNAKTQKARIKTSGTAALSNKELQAVITRTQLEQQYAKLTPESISPGRKFAAGFGNIAANAVKQVAAQQVAKLMTSQVDELIKAVNKK